jgi:hypothetical protein
MVCRNGAGRRRCLRGEHGQVLVEAALGLPILLILLFAIVSFGITWNHYLTLTDAVRVGARTGAVCHAPGTMSVDAAVRQAAGDLPGHEDPSKLVVELPNGACPPSGQTITVTARYPYSINVFGIVVAAGNLTSQTIEPVE